MKAYNTYNTYNTLKSTIENFPLTFSDKQKHIVIISRNAEQSMTATHVHKSTYERACLLVQRINTHLPTYTGANGSTWPSSFSFIPTLLTGEKILGNRDTQEGISEILMRRLEYDLTEILSVPLPPRHIYRFYILAPTIHKDTQTKHSGSGVGIS